MTRRHRPRAHVPVALLVALAVCGCGAPIQSPGSPAVTSVGASASPSPVLAESTTGPCGGATLATLPWWNARTFYEIFVRSFQDSDGDGIGDIPGLISRLDYLNDGDPSTDDDLGVTGIWLMPMAESPSYHGYDVVDYTAIERDYGTADDFTALVSEAHRRGIAVIVDLVLNHTSREHPWFVDATTPGSEHDDWYEWAATDPGITRPDGESVWHAAGDRFYYSYFWEGMADLNLANPEVTAELDGVARHWLDDLGVDGFRLDAIKHFFERDSALEELPESHAWLTAFRDRVRAEHPDALLVGEVFSSTADSAGWVPDSADLTFDFGFADAVVGAAPFAQAGSIAIALNDSMAAYPPGQRAVFLSNHDQPRVMTRFAGDVGAAKVAAGVLLTSPGVPFVYYGEEVGLTGDKPDERIRTPMPWEPETPGVGFTTGLPWELSEPGVETANVAAQSGDPESLLSTYRRLTHARAGHPALSGAETVVLPVSDSSVVAMLRRATDETALVMINLSDDTVAAPNVDLSAAPCVAAGAAATVILGATDSAAAPSDLAAYQPVPKLGPHETLVVGFGGT